MQGIKSRLAAVTNNGFLRKSSVFRQILCVILLLFLFLILMFLLVLYQKTLVDMDQTVKNNSRAILSLAGSLSDEKFSHLGVSAQSFSLEDDILGMAVFPDVSDKSRCFNTVLNLKSFVDANSYVTDAVLLCCFNDTIISSNGDIKNLESYSRAGDLSSSAVASIAGTNCWLVRTATGALGLKCLFVPCSYGYVGQLLLYLDVNALFGSFCEWDMPIAVYIDELPVYINSAGRHTLPAPQDGNALYIQSESMGLTFCGAYGEVHYSLHQFLRSRDFLLVLIVLIPVLLLLAVTTAWIFCKPLGQLLESVRSSVPSAGFEYGGKGDWSVLNDSIQKMNEQTKQLNKIIAVAAPYVQDQLLADLTDGVEADAAFVRQTLSNICSQLPFSGTFVLFHITDAHTGVLSPALIDQAAAAVRRLDLQRFWLVPFVYHYSLLAIAGVRGDQPALYAADIAVLSQAMEVVKRNLPGCSIFHSEPFYDLLALQSAYLQTVSRSRDAAFLTRRDIDERIRYFVENLTCQPEEAVRITADHLLETLRTAALSEAELARCCRFLVETVQNAVRSCGVRRKGPIIQEEVWTFAGQGEAQLREYLYAVIEEFFIKLNNRQRKYVLEAQSYVERHYADNSLSLEQVAAHVGISASYLSRIFIETYGVKFTQWLNDLRIEKAKRLLLESDHLIRDISQEVGFLSIQNFMRVFKQKTGVKPSEYRGALSRTGTPGP